MNAFAGVGLPCSRTRPGWPPGIRHEVQGVHAFAHSAAMLGIGWYGPLLHSCPHRCPVPARKGPAPNTFEVYRCCCWLRIIFCRNF